MLNASSIRPGIRNADAERSINAAFDQFRDLLRAQGSHAAEGSATRRAGDGRYELVYMPFHNVNRSAKLAVVGITPGPTQRELAYASAQRSLQLGLSDEEVFARAKESAAFGGGRCARI